MTQVDKWQKSGMVCGDITGMSLAEKSMYVIKENVWGACNWRLWQASGLDPKDLFYIYRIYLLIPDKINFSSYPAREGLADVVYDDYIKQVSEIRDYLLLSAKRGTLDKANWLRSLYLEKEWAFKRSNAYTGETVVFDSDSIYWSCVVTQDMLRYIRTFEYRNGREQFDIEFLLQDFPINYSPNLFSPVIRTERNGNNELVCVIETQDKFKFERIYDNIDEFRAGLANGDFSSQYFNVKDKEVVTVDENFENNTKVVEVAVSQGFTLKGYRYVRNTYQRLYIIEDTKGNVCEVSETNLKKQVLSGIQVDGVTISDSGSLIFPNGVNKVN